MDLHSPPGPAVSDGGAAVTLLLTSVGRPLGLQSPTRHLVVPPVERRISSDESAPMSSIKDAWRRGS